MIGGDILIANIYPYPEPALAVRADGQRVLAFVHDDVAQPQGRGAEIRALTWNGAAWSAPASLTQDTQPDFAPSAAYDDQGQAIVLWERSTLPAGITPTLQNADFVTSLEMAYAVSGLFSSISHRRNSGHYPSSCNC
jgi:hypothetical protein